ncbi:MAG: zf-HC2 domain-containing protein [bacterium]
MKEVNIPNCGRENELIGFLYGELNESEARAFQRHLHECAACSTEFAGFGEVRELVVAWRNESLSSIGLTAPLTGSSPARAAEAKPSAMAALREFFNLSPLWMKGAVAFAAILFCVLGGLALARLRDKPPAPVVAVPVTSTQSPQELKALVDQRVQEELKRIKNSQAQPDVPLTARNSAHKNLAKRTGSTEVALSQKARRPLSKTEREQLAADLRLLSAKSDSDLYLLDDTINQ